MRDALQIAGIVLLLLGFALFMGKLVPANPIELPNQGKGAFASVVTSGAFGNVGLVLMAVGGVCFFVRSFIRD